MISTSWLRRPDAVRAPKDALVTGVDVKNSDATANAERKAEGIIGREFEGKLVAIFEPDFEVAANCGPLVLVVDDDGECGDATGSVSRLPFCECAHDLHRGCGDEPRQKA